jgi:hypothetical protein
MYPVKRSKFCYIRSNVTLKKHTSPFRNFANFASGSETVFKFKSKLFTWMCRNMYCNDSVKVLTHVQYSNYDWLKVIPMEERPRPTDGLAGHDILFSFLSYFCTFYCKLESFC